MDKPIIKSKYLDENNDKTNTTPKYLGKTDITFSGLDTFECPPSVKEITLTSNELTSFCPITKQPDIYKLIIVYTPQGKALETKSLKLYIESFRDSNIFGEHLANKILLDLKKALESEHIYVTLIQNIRGGIQLTVEATSYIDWVSKPCEYDDFNTMGAFTGRVQSQIPNKSNIPKDVN